MSPCASDRVRLARPIGCGLALVLAASSIAAQPLPDEHALLIDYGMTSLQAGGGVSDLASADLDGDGDLDVIAVDLYGNRVRVFMQDAAGAFVPQAIVVTGTPEAVAPVDLDGDGDVDLVVGCDKSLRVLLNDGAASFSATTPISLAGADYTVVAVIAHDVDADGLPDVIVGISEHILPSGSYTGGVAVAFGDGRGGLVLAPTSELPQPAHRLVAADFDGDGQIDVAELGGYVSASKVDVAFGRADGSFVPSGTQYNSGLYASGLAQADLDGDGDVDLASGNKYSLPLLMNDGTGHFTAGATLSPGYYTKGIVGGDLDLDGDVDLLATSGSSYAMRLYRNGGAGTFALAKTLPTTLQTLHVMLADTNGDGYPDAWSGDYSTGQIQAGESHVLLAEYGAAKVDSLGCTPSLTASGSPAAGGAGLVVQAGALQIDQPALVLLGLFPAALPGLGGTLLVSPPWAALPAATSHGSGDPSVCDGTLVLPVSGAALGALGIGTRVYVQVLTVDPGLPVAPKVALTNGTWLEVSP
ncbi:MAG: VCBS repeat-containing protein [Planctomycetes bacterium]|nr:VCBS repeat-containing protein [Planctomycetota bacterium]